MKVFHAPQLHDAGELRGAAVCLGNFDGVHLGHQALFAEAAQHARPVAFTFHPHPGKVLQPDLAPKLITLLPPADPPEKIDPDVQQLKAPAVAGSQEVVYHVQLPREYTHHRPYPLLIVLHNSERATETLDRWKDLAREHGYILAAPEWGLAFRNEYRGSAAEHGVVELG